MPERAVISNTSPLLYLHPIRELPFLAIVDLGAGEAEVIALGLALQPSLLILDDQLGRRIATLLELTFTGTLGVLIKAKQAGHLEAVSPALEALANTTMRLHPDLIRRILAEAGEL